MIDRISIDCKLLKDIECFALRPKTKPRHIARQLEHQPLADHPERRAPSATN